MAALFYTTKKIVHLMIFFSYRKASQHDFKKADTGFLAEDGLQRYLSGNGDLSSCGRDR
jgi:hypothetical protein